MIGQIGLIIMGVIASLISYGTMIYVTIESYRSGEYALGRITLTSVIAMTVVIIFAILASLGI